MFKTHITFVSWMCNQIDSMRKYKKQKIKLTFPSEILLISIVGDCLDPRGLNCLMNNNKRTQLYMNTHPIWYSVRGGVQFFLFLTKITTRKEVLDFTPTVDKYTRSTCFIFIKVALTLTYLSSGKKAGIVEVGTWIYIFTAVISRETWLTINITNDYFSIQQLRHTTLRHRRAVKASEEHETCSWMLTRWCEVLKMWLRFTASEVIRHYH